MKKPILYNPDLLPRTGGHRVPKPNQPVSRWGWDELVAVVLAALAYGFVFWWSIRP